jgi:hypothetical protein
LIKVRLVALLALLVFSPPVGNASAWNIPGHMLSAASAYQVLRQENPQTIDKVKSLLEKHPWYAANGRRGSKMFPLLTATWCCLCRRQGGPMIFASGTRLKTDRLGITSICPSNPRGNLRVCKPESPSR